MNSFIISTKWFKNNNFFRFACIFMVLVIIVGLSFDAGSVKYNEYEEEKGRIRKIKIKKRIGSGSSRNFVRLLKSPYFWLSIIIAASVLSLIASEIMVADIAVDMQSRAIYLAASMLHCTSAVKQPQFEQNMELFRKRYKVTFEQQYELYRILCETPEITSKALLAKFPAIKITVNQLNRIRREWEFSRRCGRPVQPELPEKKSTENTIFAHLPKAGLKLFALWLESTDQYKQATEMIHNLIEKHKRENQEDDFRLLNSKKETINKKWKALSLLALAGINKLSQLDYQQHDLERILADATSYSYSTLRQFLGDLERISTGDSLKTILTKCARGNWAYIDGHMIALWSKLKSHKGYITMLGRIMPGSKLVVAHDQNGQAINFDYYPPDTHLTKIIEDYCSKIAASTGLTDFVIDREINSVEIARMFDSHRWGLICLLDANEYDGLDSFSKTFSEKMSDGTILYKARWAKWRDDPRKFIIVKESERTLVYWYTKAVARQRLTARQIISIYRQRAEVQENNFKRMIAHGALNTNFGFKRIWCNDRTHQRIIAKIDKKIQVQRKRLRRIADLIDDAFDKTIESVEKNHGRLFDIRLDKLEKLEKAELEIKNNIDNLEQSKNDIGAPIKKADRDFRKQTIMTFRTLWVENSLQKFIGKITKSMNETVGIDMVLELFFYRRAVMIENSDTFVYWIENKNLSARYCSILKEIIARFNSISLTFKNKKVIAKISDSL